ncbi:addiction module protein [Candidatus Magnetobacterium casense]|uniref:addiction module protein n=1 Tax=Candidatus Magnetobacterium casense TaxID=1455061 RepID=UPI00058CF501|nr:addiction module protein [Candidatus Magnetobacterium casensis]
MRVCDIPEINRMSVSEKILLVEELWDSITSDNQEITIARSHIEELDKRLKDYRTNPKKLLTLDELQSRIEEKL